MKYCHLIFNKLKSIKAEKKAQIRKEKNK